MLTESSGKSSAALLDVALDCVSRGWHVFPCWPRSKKPMLPNGWHGATNDEQQVRSWWNGKPNANVAIACNPSGLAVLDIDHGIADAAGAQRVLTTMGLPETYTVRTGRRPEYGLQVYFSGAVPDVGSWEAAGCSGQVKSLGGYVMAAGSIHPDSGERYEAVHAVAVAPTPESVRALRSESRASVPDDGEPITQDRNVRLTSIAGKLRNAGLTVEELEESLIRINDRRCQPPLDEGEVLRIATNVSRYKLPEEELQVSIGAGTKTSPAEDSKPRPTNWHDYFHNFDDIANAPAPRFIIDGFLEEDGVTALAAPVGQRKTIIALNIAHACCTGEPLFGRFEVSHKPARVLYLCPEMGLQSFAKRVKAIGLGPHVGSSFFCRTTASTSYDLGLQDLTPEMLDGAVVIVDTMVRFLDGDESSAKDMAPFAKLAMSLTAMGAKSVLLLVHSLKSTKDAQELSLENAIRGSGELGAFLSACWATRLQDPNDEYNTRSYLRNVKQRNFESKPFEVDCSRETYRMTLAGEPGSGIELRSTSEFRGNKDGNDEAAVALLKANPKLSVRDTVTALATEGIKRGKTWVSEQRHKIAQENEGRIP